MHINNQRQKLNWLIYISSRPWFVSSFLETDDVMVFLTIFAHKRLFFYLMNFAGCLLNLFLQAKLQK